MTTSQVNPLRLLFMAESITLAHVVRLLTLAEGQKKMGHEVIFATAEKYQSWAEAKGFQFRKIHCLDSAIFQQRLSKGQTFLQHQEISDQVHEDIRLLKELRPNVVIGDFRLSLGISAKVARVPYLGVINAYWTHFDPKDMPVPETPFLSLIGRKLAYPLFRSTQGLLVPLLLRQQANGFNKVRMEYAQPPLQSVIDSYSQADYLVFPDAPEIVPPPPTNFRIPWKFLGPVAGNLPCELPDWWPDLKPTVPVIYLNMGSSGKQELTPKIVNVLTELPAQIIVGTSQSIQRQLPHLPGRLFSATALPGDQICQRADLVICNGGAPSMYQALLEGRPTIGITNNMDQRIAMPYFARLPFVKHLRTWNLKGDQLKKSTSELLDNPLVKIEAKDFSQVLHKYNIDEQLMDAIKEVLNPKLSQTSTLDLC
ncbi:MAG: hypothetical protein JNM39_07865 [Bdellovibrionaceae bacterium]|nr:hypothetical protein [Pseudobdellovibrionaceae bacterium]